MPARKGEPPLVQPSEHGLRLLQRAELMQMARETDPKVLSLFRESRKAIAKSPTVQEAIAKRDGLELVEVRRRALEEALVAGRRLGELLLDHRPHGRPRVTKSGPEVHLAQVPERVAKACRKLARVPAATFRRQLDAWRREGVEPTQSGMTKLAPPARRRAPSEGLSKRVAASARQLLVAALEAHEAVKALHAAGEHDDRVLAWEQAESLALEPLLWLEENDDEVKSWLAAKVAACERLVNGNEEPELTPVFALFVRRSKAAGWPWPHLQDREWPNRDVDPANAKQVFTLLRGGR